MNFHRCSVESDARAILQCGVFFPVEGMYRTVRYDRERIESRKFAFTFFLFLFRKLNGSTEKSGQKISSRVDPMAVVLAG